ncbi:hypothetical protein ACIBTV_27730 [Micromonospora sp. NPDC049366]|uniref:hypothetical protein n=1 Tax=Micromonospora sp. NPDC049366 TaxID=3364271 RepID=UPI003798A1D2
MGVAAVSGGEHIEASAESAEKERRQTAGGEASLRITTALEAVSLLLEDPAHITEQPIWPGASSTRRQARPITRLQAAVWLRAEARSRVGYEIQRARGAGASWQEIAVVLGLVDADRATPYDQAVAAFEEAMADGFSLHHFGFTCATCGASVRDYGPFEPHPIDREEGHAEGCARMAAQLAEWKAKHGDD